MKFRERLDHAMHLRPVDRPPCICPGGMMNLVVTDAMSTSQVSWPQAHSEPHLMAKLSAEMFKQGGFENYGVPFCMTVEAEALGAPIHMGTTYTEPRIQDYILANSRQWASLKPMTYDSGRTQTVLEAIKLLKENNNIENPVPIIGNLTGPISLASSLVDANVFYKEMRKDPEAVHELLQFLTQELIAFGLKQLEAGADLIAISDPSGTGEILGPKLFKTFVVPYLNAITAALSKASPLGTIIHICGRLNPIFSELENLSCDVLSFDAITNVTQVKAQVKTKALMGNVSTHTLEFGDPSQVRKLAQNAIQQGVHILAPACGIGAKTKITQIQALVSAASQNCYDITCCGEKTILEHLQSSASYHTDIEHHSFEAPCNGKGICGKCLVKIVKAESMPLPTPDEKRHLSVAQLENGYRLACLSKPLGKIQFKWQENATQSHSFLVEVPQTHLVSDFGKSLTTSDQRFGVAIDIGTTTVVGSLLDLSTGKTLHTASRLNGQKTYGLDVLTRITYQMGDTNGIENLHIAILKTLESILFELLEHTKLNHRHLVEITFAGNTAMLHFLLKLPSKTLGRAPYVSLVEGAVYTNSLALGFSYPESINCYILPPISAYIGGDISSGILHLNRDMATRQSLLIDIGTNGELVLFKNGERVACSCAAGPAFEGMNLSCGMRAENGAIESFHVDKTGTLCVKTIGNAPIRGLCGSGVFDLMSELIRLNLLGKTGRIQPKECVEPCFANWICETNGKRELQFVTDNGTLKVTQQDLRQIQLAKAALRSGLEALLSHFKLHFSDLDQVYIAGQFGKYIQRDSLIGIGILPDCLKDKIVYVGNASKSGAEQCLMNPDSKRDIELIAKSVTYLELAELDGYERLFVACMNI